MKPPLPERVAHFCQKHNLFTPHDKIVVGFSGGPDSFCLLHLLNRLRPRFSLRLTVAHLNHQLRGPDAEADAAFACQIAEQWRLPFRLESRDVAGLAAARQQSIEEAARQARYTFLEQTARQVEATKIAVGHNANDQVETLLMHLLRGSGLTGLQGMRPIAPLPGAADPPPALIRPLLDTWREEIEAYCRQHNLAPRRDASNRDTAYFRNRLRHELIPYLQSYNPNIEPTLHRTANIVAADLEILEQQLARHWPHIARRETPQAIEIDLERWHQLPLALKRAALRRAIHKLEAALHNLTFDHIETAIDRLAQGQVGTKISLPQNLVIRLGYDTFTLAAADAPPPRPDQPYITQTVPVNLPGPTPLPAAPWQLRAAFLSRVDPATLKQADRWEAYLDADIAGEALLLRPRRKGDIFYPLGLSGHSKKVQTFMIDEKIPAAWRDQIPLLLSGERVLWICGYRLDERAKIRPATTRILYLKFERT